MAVTGVYPLQGSVNRAYTYYYAGDEVCLPPPGMVFEIAYYGAELTEEGVGTWERCNGDVFYLAWLMKLRRHADDKEMLAKMIKASHAVSCHFKSCNNVTDRITRAYALREHEEANMDLLGHSLLTRARELSSLQEPPRSTRGRSAPAKLRCRSYIASNPRSMPA